jgi:phosphoserine phosphatase
VEEQAAPYRARFLSGEIDYREWARLDTALWKGVELTRVEGILRTNPYRPGVHALFSQLQRNGVRTAIISSGLDVHVRQVATELGVWRTVSNQLLVRDGRLTGKVAVHITAYAKGQAMSRLREEARARPEECLAVGDGPADVDLFAQAALAVAVRPRDERVRQAAHFVVEDGDLTSIIPLLEQRFHLEKP